MDLENLHKDGSKSPLKLNVRLDEPIFADSNNEHLNAFKKYIQEQNDRINLYSQNYLNYLSLSNKPKLNFGKLKLDEAPEIKKKIWNRELRLDKKENRNLTEGEIPMEQNIQNTETNTPNSPPRSPNVFCPYRVNSKRSELTNPRYFYKENYFIFNIILSNF